MASAFSDFDLGRIAQRVEGLEVRMNRSEDFMAEQLKQVNVKLEANNMLVQRAHGALLFLGVVTSGGMIATVVDLFKTFGGH